MILYWETWPEERHSGIRIYNKTRFDTNICTNNNDAYGITKRIQIRVITKLPNSEQSYKGKVKTHMYINRQNQSTTGKLWKITSPFKLLNTKTSTTYDIGNPCPGLGQTQKYGGVKLVNGIPILTLLVTGSPKDTRTLKRQ
jgi:hypothetical protein